MSTETLVSQMTKEELIQIIESAVERKLLSLFDTLDDTELQTEVYNRLLRQKKMIAQGDRGKPFNDIIQQLDLG